MVKNLEAFQAKNVLGPILHQKLGKNAKKARNPPPRRDDRFWI